MRKLLLVGLLIALICGAHAEEMIDYSEEIGPYTVSFSLSELQRGPITFEKNISQSEELDGSTIDNYDIVMLSDKWEICSLHISNYDVDMEFDLDVSQENLEKLFEGASGGTTSTMRKIDGADGFILQVNDEFLRPVVFIFFYPKDERTAITGISRFTKEQTLTLVKTLHITKTGPTEEQIKQQCEDDLNNIAWSRKRIDYSYEVGPYIVSASVPMTGTPVDIGFDKDISQVETPDGAVYDRYVINMLYDGDFVMGTMTIRAFKENVEYDPEQYLKTQINASNSFVRYEDSEIDGAVGVIAYVRDLSTRVYSLYFAYQKDNRTTVDGVMKFPWESSLPFVENLNITKIAELPPRSV